MSKRNLAIAVFLLLCGVAANSQFSGAEGAAFERELLAAFPDVGAMLIDRGGKLVYERYGAGRNPEELLPLQSATMQVTASVIGAGIERGWFPAEDTSLAVAFNRQRANDDRFRDLSFRDFLAMSTGLVDFRSLMQYPPVERPWRLRFYMAPGLQLGFEEPNAQFLAHAASTLTGRPFAALAEEALFNPLGIRAYSWLEDAYGQVHGAVWLGLGARDMVKVGRLYLQGGLWEGKRILPERYAREAVRLQSKDPSPWIPGLAGMGYLWFIMGHPLEPGFAALGAEQFVLYGLPAKDAVILFWNPSQKGGQSYEAYFSFFQASVVPRLGPSAP